MPNSEDEKFNELITKTDAEIARLGWTTEQGRSLLVRFYNKRSRRLLTLEELDNFLLYLQLSDADESPIPNIQFPTPNESHPQNLNRAVHPRRRTTRLQ